MDNELHEVVQLLLARMKSHPEEFATGSSRWGWLVNDAMEHGSDEERAALKAGLRPIRLQEVHEIVLDELCNGEERRRKQEEMVRGQAMRISASGSIGIGTTSPAAKLGVTTGRHPTSTDMEKNSLMNAIRNIK